METKCHNEVRIYLSPAARGMLSSSTDLKTNLNPIPKYQLRKLSLGYICPDHRTIFRSAIFSTIFRHRRRSWATTYVLKIHTGIVRFFDLPFVDVLIQKRKAIVRQSYVSADST